MDRERKLNGLFSPTKVYKGKTEQKLEDDSRNPFLSKINTSLAKHVMYLTTFSILRKNLLK